MAGSCNLLKESPMQSVAEERFVFEVEWFDQQAELIRKYLLTYYPKDGQVDMVSSLPICVRVECL